MAIQFDLPLTVRATHPDAYAMIADTYIHHFDGYAELFINIYDSEDARRQNVPDSEAHRRTPLKRIRVEVPLAIYEKTMKDEAQAVAAAAYKILLTYAEPHGLSGLFSDGEAL